jgi:Uncharacterized Fe-S center protein
MEKAKVYFSDFRTRIGVSQGAKLQKLIRTAGIGSIDFDGKFVAIKMHFGELGNFAYLRPNYVKAVADVIKDLGGKPFLTDCNTLYPGSRKNAVDHLQNAEINGFNSVTTGCNVIIADGLRGTDDIEVPVVNGEYCPTALIGRAVMDADIVVSLTHFKGHEATGFGGAIKNLGMGCGSRAGKMHQHNDGTPQVDQSACRGCGRCAKECGSDAISYGKDRKAYIDPDVCKGCGRCIGACNRDAIVTDFGEPCTVMHGKIAEYTAAVVRGKPAFHISFVCDVSPHCDCHPMNDAPLVPDIGMAASFDPVALDKACADLCNAAPVMPNCCLAGQDTHGDIFATMHPVTRWQDAISEGERMGLGSGDYKLVKI